MCILATQYQYSFVDRQVGWSAIKHLSHDVQLGTFVCTRVGVHGPRSFL